MKKYLANLIGIITLGILVSLSAGYLFAANSNSYIGPPNNNAPKPLNTSSNSQVKGTGSASGAMLYVGSSTGGLSANSLAVFNNAVFGGSLTISSLTGTGTKTLCAQSDGTVIYCPTVSIPIIASTTTVTNIGPSTAVSGGNISSDGGGTVIARGVAWSSTSNLPTIAGSHSNDGTGTGVFTSSITGLTPNLFYWVRAYATNSAGTAYGPTLNFTTSSLPFILHISKSGTASSLGMITSSVGGISCGGATPVCDAVFSSSTSVTLTESGTGFTGWSGGGCSGTGTICTTTVSAATTVVATFISCDGVPYNGYCWYLQNTQSAYNPAQTCGYYCNSIGKNCINSNQTCAQDIATYSALGVGGCGSYQYNAANNFAVPSFNGGFCSVRTNQSWTCGTLPVQTSSCSSSLPYMTMLCSCDN